MVYMVGGGVFMESELGIRYYFFNTWLVINFSQNLANKGKMMIGQYEDEISGDLPSLGIRFIFDTFHWRRK